jgi:hypothetical protein
MAGGGEGAVTSKYESMVADSFAVGVLSRKGLKTLGSRLDLGTGLSRNREGVCVPGPGEPSLVGEPPGKMDRGGDESE